MKVLIKQAKILDPGSAYHQSTRDILVIDGLIREIASSINTEADHLIQFDDLFVSPGWIDVFANFCDPGYEFKETLVSGSEAAAAGGFTCVMVVPNTKPVIDLKAQVEYLIRKSADLPINVLPIGAITKQ
ncbi:MAG: dihydroorotase, partial [Chitinophagaceae bacterium]